MNYFLTYLALINLITFALFGVDKYKAKAQKRRIKESTLLYRSLAGGVIGAMAGMELFRHKTIKGKFLWKMLLIFLGRSTLAIVILYHSQ